MSGSGVPEIRLLNSIAAQFGHLPPDRAAEETANHIRMFWDPRMKARLPDLAADADTELGPVASAAVALVSGTSTAQPSALPR